jgi:hypothetical protein
MDNRLLSHLHNPLQYPEAPEDFTMAPTTIPFHRPETKEKKMKKPTLMLVKTDGRKGYFAVKPSGETVKFDNEQPSYKSRDFWRDYARDNGYSLREPSTKKAETNELVQAD